METPMYPQEVQQSAFERGYMKGYADALAEVADADDVLAELGLDGD